MELIIKWCCSVYSNLRTVTARIAWWNLNKARLKFTSFPSRVLKPTSSSKKHLIIFSNFIKPISTIWNKSITKKKRSSNRCDRSRNTMALRWKCLLLRGYPLAPRVNKPTRISIKNYKTTFISISCPILMPLESIGIIGNWGGKRFHRSNEK